MDRFMENADPEKKTQSKALQAQLSACRDRLQLLLEGKVSLTCRSFNSSISSVENRMCHTSRLSNTQEVSYPK